MLNPFKKTSSTSIKILFTAVAALLLFTGCGEFKAKQPGNTSGAPVTPAGGNDTGTIVKITEAKNTGIFDDGSRLILYKISYGSNQVEIQVAHDYDGEGAKVIEAQGAQYKIFGKCKDATCQRISVLASRTDSATNKTSQSAYWIAVEMNSATFKTSYRILGGISGTSYSSPDQASYSLSQLYDNNK